MVQPELSGDAVSSGTVGRDSMSSDSVGEPIIVTATGPAAARAERDSLSQLASAHSQVIRFVDTRSAVVLFIVDGGVEPTRSELGTISAISQATGRIAVGLYVPSGRTEPSDCAAQWRAAVPAQIPVGGLDDKMVRTLELLHSGPAMSVTPSMAQQRRALLAEMLTQQREFNAQQVAKTHQTQRRQAGTALSDAIAALADDAASAGVTRYVLMQPEQRLSRLYRVSSRAAAAVAEDIRENLGAGPQSFPIVEPRRVPPRFAATEAVMAILLLGLAAGIGRFLAVPLEWLALPELVTQTIGVCSGLLLATAASALTYRRKAQTALRQWLAGYLAQLRSAWDNEAAVLLAERSSSVRNWRLAQVENQLQGIDAGH